MTTTFYLPSSGAAGASPAYNAGWEDTSIASRLKCVTTKISSTMTTVSFNDSDYSDKDILFRQYVSDAINAQTIQAQTVTFNIRALETSLLNQLFTAIGIYVFSNDGSTLRGTILALTRDDTEVATALTNRTLAATSTSVIAQANDRIVIEIGVGGDPNILESHDSSISIGDNSGTDLPDNDTTTTADNPVVKFATDTISFADAGTLVKDIIQDGGVVVFPR